MAILPLWLSVLCAMTLFLLAVGWRVTGHVLGVLNDARNRRSLSQLQLVVWTVLLLSAVLAVALFHRTANIELAEEVWALAGISLGSAFSSVTVKTVKMARGPAEEDPARRGVLVVNTDPRQARFAEMFTGEEAGDHALVDLGKVQMFLISLTGWIAYGAALWHGLPLVAPEAGGIVRLPEISVTLVALIGISHAGYLSAKAVDKTKAA